MQGSDKHRQSPQSTQVPEDERESLREGARRLTQRDSPEDASAGNKGGRQASDRDKVYRPEANVDNQKHSGHKPGVDTRREVAPVPGAQVVRDKASHKANIDDKAEQARSNRRNG